VDLKFCSKECISQYNGTILPGLLEEHEARMAAASSAEARSLLDKDRPRAQPVQRRGSLDEHLRLEEVIFGEDELNSFDADAFVAGRAAELRAAAGRQAKTADPSPVALATVVSGSSHASKGNSAAAVAEADVVEDAAGTAASSAVIVPAVPIALGGVRTTAAAESEPPHSVPKAGKAAAATVATVAAAAFAAEAADEVLAPAPPPLPKPVAEAGEAHSFLGLRV
jgi:hypothetical protein